MVLDALKASLIGRAQLQGVVKFRAVQVRDFALDKHRTVDDFPYGGGPGMLMRADVLGRAVESVPKHPTSTRTVFLSPQGGLLTQPKAKQLSRLSQLIVICGHYEGVDQRFIDRYVDEELSIGDYVLTGGEPAAIVLADVVSRLVPGVVGDPASVQEESLENNLLKYPQYTRPPEVEGQGIPSILLSGDHGKIKAWRMEQSRAVTLQKRPDLILPGWDSRI